MNIRTPLLCLALLVTSCTKCDPCHNSDGQLGASSGGEAGGCAPDPEPTPTPTPQPEPGPNPPPVVVVPATPSCATACVRFRELGCDEGKPTNDGASCETVCSNMQSTGLIVYDLACATKVTSCAAIASCPRQ